MGGVADRRTASRLTELLPSIVYLYISQSNLFPVFYHYLEVNGKVGRKEAMEIGNMSNYNVLCVQYISLYYLSEIDVL